MKNKWRPKKQNINFDHILYEIKAMDNTNLNHFAKVFKNNQEIKAAIIKEYQIRQIA